MRRFDASITIAAGIVQDETAVNYACERYGEEAPRAVALMAFEIATYLVQLEGAKVDEQEG